MNQAAIFLPVFALAGWTFAILLLIPYKRIKAVALKQLVADDFKLGESKNVPPSVSLPNHNYTNLLELPVLFYVVCLVLFVTHHVDLIAFYLAWLYVALRVVHSVIHLTSNHVLQRLIVFAASTFVLIGMWARAFVGILLLP